MEKYGKRKNGVFNKFYTKDEVVCKTLEINIELYESLEKISGDFYNVSITDLVNTCIEQFIKLEEVPLYEIEKEIYIKRNFCLTKKGLQKLNIIGKKYDLSVRFLVNTAIKMVLIDEGIIEEKRINKE